MQSVQPLTAIPDDELLRQLAALVADSRRTEADLVLHIAEVDARKLYAREATPSMFQYCTGRDRLRLRSRGQALPLERGGLGRAVIRRGRADGAAGANPGARPPS
jgi:hypothetical protein